MQYLMLIFQLLVAGLKLVKFFMNQKKTVGKTEIKHVTVVASGVAKETDTKVSVIQPVSGDARTRMKTIESLIESDDFQRILNPDTTTPPDWLKEKYTDE